MLYYELSTNLIHGLSSGTSRLAVGVWKDRLDKIRENFPVVNEYGYHFTYGSREDLIAMYEDSLSRPMGSPSAIAEANERGGKIIEYLKRGDKEVYVEYPSRKVRQHGG